LLGQEDIVLETIVLGESAHLREYVRVIRKRLWLILACLTLVVVATAIATFLQRPLYRATTKALIEREAPRVTNIQDVAPTDAYADDSFQTQIQIIRSRPVAQRVITSLGLLTKKPELAGSSDPVATFLGDVRAEPIRNTRLVQIQVEDYDPQLAADIANAVASTYVRQNLELKLNAARDALGWLTSQVGDLKSQVNTSELALQRYREQAGLVTSEDKQSLAGRKLVEFNAAYIDAKSKRLEMETRLTELRKAGNQREAMEASAVVINNPLIQRLKGQLVELEVQRSKLLKTYREKHPEVVKIQSQVDEITQKISEEITRLTQSMDSEYKALKAREDAMVQAVNQYRDEAQSVSKKEIQYGILKRDVESNQQLYDVLLKRLKETGLSQGLDTNNVRIVEPAEVPVAPVRPRPMMNMGLAVIGGLILSLSIAFFAEYMDDTIRTPDQVEHALGVPVFALVPATTRTRS
jgi:succinoglycan biosynthesis transport protein ExoP